MNKIYIIVPVYNVEMVLEKCITKVDVKKLIAVELKNIIVSYWIMCEKIINIPMEI